MPLRNRHGAPTFDTSRPRELRRYFEDLEELMDEAHIADDADKKKKAVYYVDFETEQFWKAIPKFEDPNISYEEFKQAILVHYPEAADDFRYSLRDLDLLIGKHQHLGINSVKDLADYNLHFTAITNWLIKKQHLSDLERRRIYIQVFRPQLLTAITNQLRLENPGHHPNIPYPVPKVHAAAEFILLGNYTLEFNTSTATPIPPSTDNIFTAEHLIPFMAEVTKTVVKTLKIPNMLL